MLLRKIRKLIRFVAALTIWAHGLAVLPAYQPPFRNWAAAVKLTESEAVLIFILALLSVLWSYGLANFALDLGYIYIFPFVLLYYIIRMLLRVIRFLYDTFSQEKVTGLAIPAVPPGTEAHSATPRALAAPSETGKAQPPWKKLLLEVSRPVRQFTLLWGLLLLLSSKPWILWIALTVVILHLFRALFKILILTVFSIRWLSGLEDRLKAYAEGLIAKVLDASQRREADKQADIRKWLGTLISLKMAAAVLASKRLVAQSVLALGFLTFAVIYAYISLLFSFAYYGLARVLSITFSWGQALVTSIFIPIMVTALPHNTWLLLLGGIHALFVIFLGVGTVLRFLGKKLDAVKNTAESLNAQLEKEDIKTAMVQMAKELNIPYPGAEGAPNGQSG